MNIIDSLVLTLGLDSSSLKQGAKEATATTAKLSKDMVDTASKAEKGQNESLGLIVKGLQALGATQKKTADESVKHSKSMSTATESVAQSGEKALRTFGALFLLFAGAHSLKSFISDMVNLDAATGRAAQNMGQTPEALSGIGRAVERMGGTFNGAVGGLRGLSDAFEQMRTTGNSAIMEPLARLQGLSGKAITLGKDVRSNLYSIADALHAVKDPAMADYLGRQILGDQGLVDLARRGGAAGIQEAERQSPKITRQQTEDAQKLQAQLAAVRQGFQDIGNSILMDFGPAMLKGITWVKDLVANNRVLIETKVSEWVKDVGTWFSTHKADVDAFGKAIGDLVLAAGGLATAFASQSPTMQALELFAATMGGRVLGAIGLVRSAMTALGSMPVPASLAAAIGLPLLGTAAVGTVLASGDPDKIPLVGGHPDTQPQDSDLGLPGVGEDRKSDTSDTKAKVDQAGGLWDKFKKAIGWGDRLHDDAKTKDDIADTAKGVKEIRDLVKDGTSLTGSINGVTSSSGGLGGSGQHLGGGSSPGATLGDRARGRLGGGGGAHGGGGVGGGSDVAGRASKMSGDVAARAKTAIAQLEAKGWTHEAAAAAIGNAQQESGVRSDGPLGDTARFGTGDDAAHGMFQWRGQRFRDLKKFADARGTSWQDFKTQVDFFDEESKKYGSAEWRQSHDIVHANRGMKRFEGYGDNSFGTRLANARQLAAGRNDGAVYQAEPAPTAQAPVSAGTPAAAVTDAEVFAARQRISAGGRDPKDIALRDRYLKEQNTPKGAPASAQAAPHTPTVDHVIHHVLKALAHARGLTHHNDNKPVAVMPVDKNGVAPSGNPLADLHRWRFDGAMKQAREHAAALDRMTRVAGSGGYSTHNVDRSVTSDTRINGGIHVHTAATDARGIAADIEPHLHRGQAAGRADYGLA